MARGVSHSDETKAAVMAALLAGQSVGEIAAEYKLSESTVRSWRKSLPDDKFAEVRDKKGETFDDLLFGYLRASLVSLKIQVEHFGDKGWLQKQPASELAVLHGVQTDKAIRLLGALEAASAAGEQSGADRHGTPAVPGIPASDASESLVG